MADSVAVDTNWLLDVALSRDEGSAALWREARLGNLRLVLPAVAIVEALKVLEGWDKEWRRFSAHLGQMAGVASPEQMLLASAQLADRAERLVWQTLQQASTTAELLEVTSATIARASNVRDFLKLSAADALVLSLVVDASESGICGDFLSRDRTFQKGETKAYLEEKGIAFWSNATPYLAARGEPKQ